MRTCCGWSGRHSRAPGQNELPAYGRAGISEVWLINLPEQSIEVYRERHFAGYASASVRRAGEQARPAAFPDVAIDVRTLLL